MRCPLEDPEPGLEMMRASDVRGRPSPIVDVWLRLEEKRNGCLEREASIRDRAFVGPDPRRQALAVFELQRRKARLEEHLVRSDVGPRELRQKDRPAGHGARRLWR